MSEPQSLPSVENQGNVPGCLPFFKIISFSVFGIIALIVIKYIDRHYHTNIIPFNPFAFWELKAPIGKVLSASKYLFFWGIGLSFISQLAQLPMIEKNIRSGIIPPAEMMMGSGCLFSVIAGVFEEIIFRWLFFLNFIWLNQLIDYCLLGFVDWGLFQIFYNNILAPVADFFTFGKLSDVLFSPLGWFVGAAMLSANASFRDQHMYQGLLGFINSWFVGMYLFWIMFNFGLPAAILVHFLYDFFVIYVIYSVISSLQARPQ